MPVLHQRLRWGFDLDTALHRRDSGDSGDVGYLEFVVEREYNRARPLFYFGLPT